MRMGEGEAEVSSGAVVQALAVVHERARFVVMKAKPVVKGGDQGVPFFGERERAAGHQHGAGGDLPVRCPVNRPAFSTSIPA